MLNRDFLGRPPGFPARDDPEVIQRMTSIDALTDEQRQELIPNVIRASIAYRRTQDPRVLTGWREAKCPPGDEAVVTKHLAVVRSLLPSERRALLVNVTRYLVAYERTGDQEHLDRWCKNFFATLHLRTVPEYVEALRTAPRKRGRSRPISEVLASLRHDI